MSPEPKKVLRVSEAVEFTRDSVLEVDWIQLKRALTSRSREGEVMRTPRAVAQLHGPEVPKASPSGKVRTLAGSAATSHAAANAAAVAAALAMIVKVDSAGYGPTAVEQAQLADPLDAAERWCGLGPGEAEDDEEVVQAAGLAAWSIPPEVPPELPPKLLPVAFSQSWGGASEAPVRFSQSPRIWNTGDVRRTPSAHTACGRGSSGAVRCPPEPCCGDATGIETASPPRLSSPRPRRASAVSDMMAEMPVLLGTTAPMLGFQHKGGPLVKGGRVEQLPKNGASHARSLPLDACARNMALGPLGEEDVEPLAAFLKRKNFAGPMVPRRRRFRTDYALHAAVEERDAQMVRLLLLARADPVQKNSEGQTAEELARCGPQERRLAGCLVGCSGGRVHDPRRPSNLATSDIGNEDILRIDRKSVV